jgi:A/G-specific adenine glycosylase
MEEPKKPRGRLQAGEGARSQAGNPKALPWDPSSLRFALLGWQAEQNHDLPWRRSAEPYAVVVSEFMLQQTRVATVLPYYRRWMERFPNWESVAQAPREELLLYWEGLGYYRRVGHLQRLARWVVEHGDGELPKDPKKLQELPGVGPYTARAIALFAFGRSELPWDGNVSRVLGRLFAEDPKQGGRHFRQKAQALLPPTGEGAVAFVNGLMDLGRRICLPRSPRCSLCPWQSLCLARGVAYWEGRKPRQKVRRRLEQLAIVVDGQGAYWLFPCSHQGLWQGLWCLPSWEPERMEALGFLGDLDYSVTRYRVRAKVWRARWKGEPSEGGRWVEASGLDFLPLPRPHRRALELLRARGSLHGKQ